MDGAEAYGCDWASVIGVRAQRRCSVWVLEYTAPLRILIAGASPLTTSTCVKNLPDRVPLCLLEGGRRFSSSEAEDR